VIKIQKMGEILRMGGGGRRCDNKKIYKSNQNVGSAFSWKEAINPTKRPHPHPDPVPHTRETGLAQGCQMVHLFSNQKFKFGPMFESLAMEDVGIFYGHLLYFIAI
jgi:hypothetical protein